MVAQVSRARDSWWSNFELCQQLEVSVRQVEEHGFLRLAYSEGVISGNKNMADLGKATFSFYVQKDSKHCQTYPPFPIPPTSYTVEAYEF